jgi:2-isopropylmalate synthase
VSDDSRLCVGNNVFAHKEGIYVPTIERNPETYEYINPALIGNERRILISDS